MILSGGGIHIPGTGGSGGGGAAPFNGQYASLFPGAYQLVQTDLGLTVGATLKPAAGNTSVTAITTSGSFAGTPVPVLVKATNTATVGSGATFDIYYDGIGVTPAMVGVTPTGAAVALTGAGAGLSLQWSIASSVNTNTWRATCAGLADQSGNGKHYTQATAGLQPIITAGLNGKPGLLFDAIDDYLVSTITLPYPVLLLVVGRAVSATTSANSFVGGDTPFQACIISLAAGDFSQYSGVGTQSVTPVPLTNQRFAATFTATTADSFKMGSAAIVTGTNTGGLISTTRSIGAIPVAARNGNCEIFMVGYVVPASIAAFDAAINSAAGYGPGAIVV